MSYGPLVQEIEVKFKQVVSFYNIRILLLNEADKLLNQFRFRIPLKNKLIPSIIATGNHQDLIGIRIQPSSLQIKTQAVNLGPFQTSEISDAGFK